MSDSVKGKAEGTRIRQGRKAKEEAGVPLPDPDTLDEETRGSWAKGNPDYVMPEHEEPPYDRDRLMPAPMY